MNDWWNLEIFLNMCIYTNVCVFVHINVCVCTYIYVCICTCMYIHYVCTLNQDLYMHTYIYEYTSTYTYICMYTHMHTHIDIWCLCRYTDIHTQKYSLYICVCNSTCISKEMTLKNDSGWSKVNLLKKKRLLIIIVVVVFFHIKIKEKIKSNWNKSH